MLVLTRTTRTSTEVAGERAEAAWKIESYGPTSAYLSERLGVVVETLDWLEGRRSVAPATGLARPANDQGIADEWRVALRLDEQAVRALRPEVRPATVAETLAWYLLDPTAESPA